MLLECNQQQDRATESGFTLIEVLIAMLIATMAFLALAMMQGNAIQANSFSNKLTQATILAQAKLEQLNSSLLSPNDAKTTDLNVGSTDTLEGIDENGEPGGPFTLNWAVEANTAFSRKVTVTVTWTNNQIAGGGSAKTHKVELNSVTRGVFYEST